MWMEGEKREGIREENQQQWVGRAEVERKAETRRTRARSFTDHQRSSSTRLQSDSDHAKEMPYNRNMIN